MRQPAGRDFQPADPEEERIEVDPQHPDDPFGLYEDERGGGGGFFTRRKVIIALVTGLIAFAIAAVVVTAGELTFGDSTSSGQQDDVLRRPQELHADPDPHADGDAQGGPDAHPDPQRLGDTLGHAWHASHRDPLGDPHAERCRTGHTGHPCAHAIM